MPVWRYFLDEFLHHLKTIFLVRHLPASKTQRHFHLHVFTKEIDRMRQFHPKIMRINRWTQLNLFDLVGVLMFLGFLLLLGLFVTEFPKINNATYRRCRVRRYLNKVNPVVARHVDGFA